MDTNLHEWMQKRSATQSGDRRTGAALVATILVLAVLTVMVVAFLQSMRVERLTARAYLGLAVADALSQAGVETALDRLAVLETLPHATVFTRNSDDDVFPLLYRREWDATAGVSAEVVIPAFSTRANISSLSSEMLLQSALALTDVDSQGNVVNRIVERPQDLVADVNAAFSSLRSGLVGLEDSAGDRVPLKANWIYVKDSNDRVIGRYAFWIDDESSKIDLRTAGNVDGTGLGHARGAGEELSEIALHALGRLPGAESLVADDFQTLLQTRAGLDAFLTPTNKAQLLSPNLFRYFSDGSPNPALTNDVWSAIRPHVTLYSRHDDRAPDGRRRMNLNEVVTNTDNPVRIQQEVEAIRDFIMEQLPNFALRAHGGPGPVTVEQQQRYLTQLAANIRDMIDDDNTATVILEDGTALAGTAPDPELGGSVPLSGLVGDDLPLAIGKESGPFLSEYTRLMKVVSGPSSGTGTVVVRPVHYIEFHNVTNQAITYADMGPNPFVRIANRAPWSMLPAGTFRPADIIIRLPTGFSIPANGYAVVTTDAAPFFGSQTALLGTPANRFQVARGTSGAGTWNPVNAGGQMMPTGTEFENYSLTLQVQSSNRYHLQTNIRSQGYGQNETRLLLGNDLGLIDLVLMSYEESNIYLGRDVRNPTMHNAHVAGNTTSTDNNGGSGPRFTRGDPRTNTEFTVVEANTKSVWIDGLGSYGDNIFSGGRMTQGGNNHSTNLGSTTVNQALPEWSAAEGINHRVLNAPLVSLGQLGFVMDPARRDRTHRGGGRSLRIGQSDAPANLRDGISGTGSEQWLGGFGSADPAAVEYHRSAHLITSIFRTDAITSGRVNPHAALRADVPAALLAAMEGFEFDTVADGGDANSAGRPLAHAGGIPLLISAIQQDLLGGRAFFDAGELSRLPVFHEGTNLVSSVNSRSLHDSAREEFLRRSLNLMHSQSMAFTIHVVAQSGRFTVADRFQAEATARRSRVVEFIAEYPDPYDELVPTAPVSWNTRVLREMKY